MATDNTVDTDQFAAFQEWQRKNGEKKMKKEAVKLATKALIAAHTAEYNKLVESNS